MVYLYTSQTPSIPAVLEGGAGNTLAQTFYANVAGTVSGGRMYSSSDAVTGTFEGVLWGLTSSDASANENSGTVLATASFTPTPGGWNTFTFSSPVSIAANTTYKIGFRTSAGQYAATGGFFNSVGISNSPLFALQTGATYPDSLTYYNGSFIENNYQFPHKTFNGNAYFIDPDFTVASFTKDLDLQSRVLGAITKDLDLQSRVLAAITKDVDLQSRVLAVVTNDLVLNSRVLNDVIKDLDLQSRVLNVVQSDLDIQSRVLAAFTKDLDLQSRLFNAIVKDLDLVSRVRNGITVDLELWSSILSANGFVKDLVISSKVLNLVQKDLVIMSAVLDEAGGLTFTLWNGTSEIPLTLSGVWNGTQLVPITFSGIV